MSKKMWTTKMLLNWIINSDIQEVWGIYIDECEQHLQTEYARIVALLKAFDLYVEPKESPLNAIAEFETGNFILKYDNAYASEILQELIDLSVNKQKKHKKTTDYWSCSYRKDVVSFRLADGKIIHVDVDIVMELQNKYDNRRIDESQAENYKKEIIASANISDRNVNIERIILRDTFSEMFCYRKKLTKLINCCKLHKVSSAIIREVSFQQIRMQAQKLDEFLLKIIGEKKPVLADELIEKYGFPPERTIEEILDSL